MSKYTKIPDERGDAAEDLSYRTPKYESFQLEKDKEVQPFVISFKLWCTTLMLVAIPFPVVAWFAESRHILFYQSLAFCIAQVVLGFMGRRTTKTNIFIRLESYKKYIHIYFLALIAAIVANQAFLTWSVVDHNDNNCNDFTLNKVCKGRWGIMSEQLILILFYPTIITLVFVLYRFFLLKVRELRSHLLQKEV